jgi:tetratricopeptide (TPR) repeat protein
LYVRALSISERHWGDDHPYTASSLNNLAVLYQHQGKYEQAEQEFQRVLNIQKQRLGPDHPDTAGSYYWLAFIAHQQQHYEVAEPLYERALLIWEAVTVARKCMEMYGFAVELTYCRGFSPKND